MWSIAKTLSLAFAALACYTTPARGTTAPNTSEVLEPPKILGATNAEKACNFLSKMLPGNVDYRNSAGYQRSNLYWAAQQEAYHPLCYVRPRNAIDVASIMRVLTSYQAPFTVKSGGTSTCRGSSNIDGGVNVDLVNLNTINTAIIDDGSHITLGPAARWGDVYRECEGLLLGCIGAMAADASVGGFLLGGGMHFFAQKYGFAGDNIRLFEVVTATGDIVEATTEHNSDLYWALRGGGGPNFGIVTRFDVYYFWTERLWANTVKYSANTPHEYKRLIRTYTNYTLNGLITDRNATSVWVTRQSKDDKKLYTEIYNYHPEPPFHEKRVMTPEVFWPLQEMKSAISNVTELTHLTNHSKVWNEPFGGRHACWSVSVSAKSSVLMAEILDLWYAHVDYLRVGAKTTPYEPKLILYPITKHNFVGSTKRGGSSREIPPGDAPMFLIEVHSTWEEPSLDLLVDNRSQWFVYNVELLARNKGLFRPFIHMNCASNKQDVFGGYTAETKDGLQQAAMKWDPKGDLHKLWEGYFKLPRYDLM